MKRPVRHDDLLRFHFLARPAFSPDGSKIAYMVHRANLEKNGYDSNIWVYDLTAGDNRRLTSSDEEQFFAWDDGGASLIFASRRGKGGEGTSFYTMALDGGEARPHFSVPQKCSAVTPLGGGRYLLTAVWEPPVHNPEGADYLVFEQLPFMANGQGFVGQRRTGLGLYDRVTGAFTRLTPEAMDVERHSLAPDGGRVLLVGTEYRDVKPLHNHVYELDLASGAVTRLSEGLAFSFKAAEYFRDGVLTVGCDRAVGGANQNVRFHFLKDRSLDCLTPDLDSSLQNATSSDCRYGLADQAGQFAVLGDSVLHCATEGYRSNLYERSGGAVRRRTNLSTVDNWAARDERIAAVGFRGLQLQELYLVDGDGERQLTDFNGAVTGEFDLSTPEYVQVDNGEGLLLDGWYMKPIGFEEGRRYPTILHIHGGPKAAFGDGYFHEMQCWAARGYAVVYTNPRGSDGRGEAFSDIRGQYGAKDYDDLTAFTDWCVENLPFVDPRRLFVTGGSYGGYMTNWMVTHTDRFRAAAAQRSISNWGSKFGSSDIGYYYVQDQHGGRPWESDMPWKDSPLRYAPRARTPLLLLQSTEDYRCEMDQAFQMFTAMKVLGVESRLCLFKGENHELSRSGRPKNRLARLREIVEWFDNHGGKQDRYPD